MVENELKIMRRKLFRYICSAALKSGFVLGRAVSARDLIGLLRKLRPSAPNGVELIRIGSMYDGGYLVPNDLEDITAVFSPGVANVSDFELFFAQRGLPIYMIDPSVDAPPIEHNNFFFERKSLSISDSDSSISLESWVKARAGNCENLLLQMDIEGAEYAALATATDDVLKRFKILVIEFHRLEALATLGHFELFKSILFKLSRFFQIVHIHPNNADKVYKIYDISVPSVVEVTFYRREGNTFSEAPLELPHPLDRPNKPYLEDIKPPNYWLSN